MGDRHKKNMMMMSMAMMRRTTTSFTVFLFENLKGERFWVVLAALLTIVQFASELLQAFPLKLILDKILSHKNPDFPFTDPILNYLDYFTSPVNLRPGEPHTQLSVIIFSACLLILLGLINAIVTYIQNSIASIVG